MIGATRPFTLWLSNGCSPPPSDSYSSAAPPTILEFAPKMRSMVRIKETYDTGKMM
jgi:hypothetical protein